MSAAFTPGPWKVAGWVRRRGHFLIIDGSTAGRQLAVADDEDELIDSLTAKANANLIATAPELYQALVQCLPVIDSETRLGKQIRAAVAKARGEVTHTPIGDGM
jgi:hypothetical protein